jgi:hypothetical protein
VRSPVLVHVNSLSSQACLLLGLYTQIFTCRISLARCTRMGAKSSSLM